jgi:rhamnose utilization protein RhaD (predicted bifunctional aldolase and dehydrogenase)/NAD(P)-dependent dehydrogenase (short-subunit alcohol dehydrogenase family)
MTDSGESPLQGLMENRYSEDDAKRLVTELGVPETLALRTYTARLLGKVPDLVVHGGGNTSAKATVRDRFDREIDVLYVKGSGWDLGTIEPAGHPAVRLAPLRELRRVAALSDEDMVRELRSALIDPGAPTPSVEALLHAFLPARFVDHTHADAVLALADQPNGERLCRDVYGDGLAWVPYVMPGFMLAPRTADAFDANPKTWVIVLEKHGIFTFGETAKESYDRMIHAVTLAERAIADKRRTVSARAPVVVQGLESRLLPRIRGVLARAGGDPLERGPIVHARTTDLVHDFLSRTHAEQLVSVGPATPDHVLRTKPTALYVRDPSYADLEALGRRMEAEVEAYGLAYDAYFEENCRTKQITRKKLDSLPRVLLLPGFGMCTLGKTLDEAMVVADVYEHTMMVMMDADDIGTYQPVSRSDLFDVEYWSLEQAKLKPPVRSALSGAVALVTGAASGIGLATAAMFVELGAHVVLVDRDEAGLAAAKKTLPATRATSFRADVTIEGELRAAVAHACRSFGGLDILVSSAGDAPQGRLDTSEGAGALRSSLEVNLMSHNHAARAAAEVMIAQGRGGALLFNVSKAAFNPGPRFGPYAVAKAALLALARQYAIDLGSSGVRSNAVNADRIRTKLFAGDVVEQRARARGVSVDEYFKDNLLSREVTATDVAQAFAHLAQARATTGCVVTVDGGNPAAFPR